MIWWGYAGFTGAVVASLAMLAAIVGLSMEIVVNLAAWSAGLLVGFGVFVHVCVLALRKGAPDQRSAPRVEPAVFRPALNATASPVSAMRAKPRLPDPRRPGAVAVLFPGEPAHEPALKNG